MAVMSVILLVTLAGCNVALEGKCKEAFSLLEESDSSAVDSKDIFVVDGSRGGWLMEETVTVSTISEAFRRTLTTTRLKQKLSGCIKHPDNPPTGLYAGPLNPKISNH